MIAPALEQKSPHHIMSVPKYLMDGTSSGTFTSHDIFWKLSSLGKVQNDSSFLDVLDGLPSGKTTTFSRLESLPAENLNQILEDIKLEPSDILSLGVCSKRLWACVLANVRTRFAGGAGQ